jgi:PadR family transcriptional regulator, regulatory protein PadR
MGRVRKQAKAKYYSLTTAGRQQLREEARDWKHMAETIAGILNTAPEEI